MITSTDIFVEYLYPGALFSESSAKKVPDRNPRRDALAAPEGAYAFRYFTRLTATADYQGRPVTLRSGEVDPSPGKWYLDATAHTVSEIERLAVENPREYRVLLSNMTVNHYNRVARCRSGNWQFLGPGSVIISSKTGDVTS